MNHSNNSKLNDRKRKLSKEYKSGENYFLETSKENYINKNNLYNESMYKAFLESTDKYKDESLDDSEN